MSKDFDLNSWMLDALSEKIKKQFLYQVLISSTTSYSYYVEVLDMCEHVQEDIQVISRFTAPGG